MTEQKTRSGRIAAFADCVAKDALLGRRFMPVIHELDAVDADENEALEPELAGREAGATSTRLDEFDVVWGTAELPQ